MSIVFGEDLRSNGQPYKEPKQLLLPKPQPVETYINLSGNLPDERALFKAEVAKPSCFVSSLSEFEDFLRQHYPAVPTSFKASLDNPTFRSAELLLTENLKLGHRIAVVFDSDLDGICSAAILVKTLRTLKSDIDIRLFTVSSPTREISEQQIRATKAQGCDLVFFLDLGTIQDNSVAQVREQGQSSIVIDHHYYQSNFRSSANVFMNLREEADFQDYPSSHLTASLSQKLLGKLTEPVSLLAALGIKADQVRLSADNRRMLSLGLESLRKSTLPFAQAFKRQICKVAPTANDLVMKLIPIFNAARRSGLFEPKDLAALFIEANPEYSEKLVRKMAIVHVLAKKRAQIAKNAQSLDDSKQVLKYSDLIALVKDQIYSTRIEANRICRETGKTTFVLKRIKNSEGQLIALSGSAKCPDFDLFNLTRLLASKKIVDCLLKDGHNRVIFGGHRHAVYLQIDPNKVETFLEEANALIAVQSKGQDLRFFNQPLAELPLSIIKTHGLQLLQKIEQQCEPTGHAFPAPLLRLSNVRVGVSLPLSDKLEGARRMMLSQAVDGLDAVQAISYSFRAQYLKAGDRVDLIARLILEDAESKRPPQQQLAALEILAILKLNH
jgi:single-stranded-DNA-specific exonuclease